MFVICVKYVCYIVADLFALLLYCPLGHNTITGMLLPPTDYIYFLGLHIFYNKNSLNVKG